MTQGKNDFIIADATSKLLAADDVPWKYMQISNWDNSEIQVGVINNENKTIWRKKIKLSSFHNSEAYLDRVGSITRNVKLMAAAPYIIQGLLDITEEQRQEIERLKEITACNPPAPPASESGEASGEELPR